MDSQRRIMVPDYYAMLGVLPDADRPTIEAALARCQPQWSSGTRNPKTKHTYQSYLDQIPAIRRSLLGDPAERAAYDAERAVAIQLDRDARLDRLERLVRLRAAKGGLSISDRDLLRGEAVQLDLTPDDLDRLTELIPPRPEPPPEDDPPDPPRDVLDPTTRRQVRVALEHLRRRDLYEVLDLPRDAPAAEVQARADALRQRWMHKSQVTAEKTAWLEAVSYAQSHLASPEARARYDRTLLLEAEEAFEAAVSFAVQGLARLDPGTRQALSDEAAALGVTPQCADQLIGRICRARGVAREGGTTPGPAPGAPTRWLRCRICSGVNDFARVAVPGGPDQCRHCRAPLRWECPACRSTRWIDERRCACGFRIELRDPLIRHFEAAQQAFRTRDYAAALEHLRRVQEFAPQHVGARRGIEKVQERRAEIDRARLAVEAERAARRMVAALAAVQAWARLVDPSDTELRAAWSEVVQNLRDARTLVARGQGQLATDPAAAKRLFRQALALAADLPEAVDALRRAPPNPPADLHAELGPEGVRLRWNAAPDDGLGPAKYRVVRKRGGVPAHPGDGALVAEVAATACHDPGATAGEQLGYAIFSHRHEADSPSGATAGPFWILADVTGVVVEVQSREVHLRWTLPPAAVGVRIVRKRGSAPTGPGDGEPVEALRDRACDRGLEDDAAYHYGLYALYRLPDGQARTSRGVCVAASPHAPIAPIEALSVTREADGRVRLTWPASARGQVRIVRSARPLPFAVGERLDAEQTGALDGTWLDPVGPDHAFDTRPTVLGCCHYTPLTVWGGSWTVGRGVPLSCLDDPSDLRAVRVGHGGRVHLRWRWSPQASQALIVARAGAPPTGPDDPNAVAVPVLEADYSHQGYVLVNLPTGDSSPWYIRVYSVVTGDGGRLVSSGLDSSAAIVVPGPNPEVTVSYTLQRPRFRGKGWSLTFRTEPAGAQVPPTLLVAHPRTVPLSVEDGEAVAHFPASHDGAIHAIVTPLDLSRHRARVFPDPRYEPNGIPPIRLRHPDTSPARA